MTDERREKRDEYVPQTFLFVKKKMLFSQRTFKTLIKNSFRKTSFYWERS